MTRGARLGRVAVVVAIVALGVFGAVGGRGLFADGAYALWHVVAKGASAVTSDRLLGSSLTSAPATLATVWGVRDIPTLAVIQGFGEIVLVAAIWALALVVLLRHRLFWVFVATFAVVYLNSGFVSVGDYNIAYALVALAASVLIRADDRRPWHGVALIVAAVVLLRAYESMAFLGPLLAVLTVLELRRGALGTRWRWVLRVAVGLFGASTVIAIVTIILPRDPRNRDNAANLLRSVSLDHQLVLSAFVAVLFVVVLMVARGRVAVVTMLGLSVAALAAAVPALWAKPGYHYDSRVTTGVLLCALLVLAAIADRRAERAAVLPSIAPLVPLALLAGLLVPFTAHTIGFNRWLATFQSVLADGSGPIFIDDTALAVDSQYYAWSWTNPYLSVLLRPEGSDAVVQPSESPAGEIVLGSPISSDFHTGPLPRF